jgi:small subunit ribosomal protein S9
MMAEENDQPTPEQPEEPTAEAPPAEEEAPPAEEETEATPPETDPEVSEEAEPPADEPDEQPASAEEQPASDPAAPGSEAEEAAGGDAEEAAGSAVKAKDAPPGAELEPIAIEAEQELTAEERARREAEAEERARAEAEATADAGEEPTARTGPAAEVDASTRIQATGKRKSSIARVVLTAGDGTIEVNSRKLDEYFPRPHHQAIARQALVTAGYEDTVDVRVRVQGGGISGQAGAVRHGIARALTEIEPELRRDLKRRGLLTRDARRKERRKAGLKKARKRPQFSKR